MRKFDQKYTGKTYKNDKFRKVLIIHLILYKIQYIIQYWILIPLFFTITKIY